MIWKILAIIGMVWIAVNILVLLLAWRRAYCKARIEQRKRYLDVAITKIDYIAMTAWQESEGRYDRR